MKTLAELRAEAEHQDDALKNPRQFLANFPSGWRNGKFVDPFLGLMQIDDIPGVIYIGDLKAFTIDAIWTDGNNS